jgi:hypothetical protein
MSFFTWSYYLKKCVIIKKTARALNIGTYFIYL